MACHLRTAPGSSQQQDHLIQALLTLARSEAGVSRRESFELGVVIDNVLLSPELDAESRGLEIRAKTSPASVSGDPRLIERLVRNLVDNAIRYNQPSGRVDITVGTRSGRAVLAVANTGPPVPPADVDLLFQPFQRLNPNRNSHPDGTGLGLSIVKAIADAHGATVITAPQPHGGLRIEVSFLPHAAAVTATPNSTVPGGRVRAGVPSHSEVLSGWARSPSRVNWRVRRQPSSPAGRSRTR